MKLLDPTTLGPLTLPNRMVMAPMTRNRAGDGNVPQAMNATYYRQRATAGLIVTEATQVAPRGVGYPHTPGIHTDAQVEGWRRVTDAVHDAGGHIFLQLWHVGRISHPSFHDGETPVAPSAIRPEGEGFTATGEQAPFPTPRALATDEVPEVVAQFRHGAEQAKAAGFDGVEIHGANGYLIDQFLRSGTNRRTDRYGGSVDGRVRFLREVTEAVVDVWGADRVGVRLSPLSDFNDMHDDNPEETFGRAAEVLSALDTTYLHLVGAGETPITEGAIDDVHGRIRAAFDGPLMVNGGYDRASGEAALQSGFAELVSYGRPFLANPDLPRRFAEDAPLNEPDPATFYGGDAAGYIDYPTLDDRDTAEPPAA